MPKIYVFLMLLVLACPAFQPCPSQAQDFFKSLESVLVPPSNAPKPTNPAYLGLRGDETPTKDQGVVVTEVYMNSPAFVAGLKTGDILHKIDQQPILKVSDLAEKLASAKPGSKMIIEYEREGKMISTDVVLGQKPTIPAANEKPQSPAAPLPPPIPEQERERAPVIEPNERGNALLPPPIAPEKIDNNELKPPLNLMPREVAGGASLGISIHPVTEEARRTYNLGTRTGALVGEVFAGSPAETAGLPVGAAIIAADGRRVILPEDLMNIVLSMAPGEEIMLSYYVGPNLFRKTITLGESPRDNRLPREAPLASVPEDRPLLRRLERVLEPAVRPATDNSEVAALREEVAQLRQRIADLERKMLSLEPKER